MATEETNVSTYKSGIGQETAIKLFETAAIILALSFGTTVTVTQWIEFSELIQCEMWEDWLWRMQFSNHFGFALLVAMSTMIFIFGMVSEEAWWSFHWVFVTETIIALPFYMAVHLLLMQFLTKHVECQQDNMVNALKGEGLSAEQLLDDAEDADTSAYGKVVGPIAWYLFCLPLVIAQFAGAIYLNHRAKKANPTEPAKEADAEQQEAQNLEENRTLVNPPEQEKD